MSMWPLSSHQTRNGMQSQSPCGSRLLSEGDHHSYAPSPMAQRQGPSGLLQKPEHGLQVLVKVGQGVVACFQQPQSGMRKS